MCAHGHLKSEFLAQALVALYLCAIVMLGFGLAVPWHTQLSQTMHCVESYAKCDVQMASEAAAFVLVSGVITFLSILNRKRQLSILTYNTSLFVGSASTAQVQLCLCGLRGTKLKSRHIRGAKAFLGKTDCQGPWDIAHVNPSTRPAAHVALSVPVDLWHL